MEPAGAVNAYCGRARHVELSQKRAGSAEYLDILVIEFGDMDFPSCTDRDVAWKAEIARVLAKTRLTKRCYLRAASVKDIAPLLEGIRVNSDDSFSAIHDDVAKKHF